MNDIKLIIKNEKELETLILAVRIFIEKYVMLIMRSGKRHIRKGIKLSNQEKIRTLREKETYKYLGILEVDTIKQVEMNKKFKKYVSGKRENYPKPNYIAGFLSKG